MSPFEIAPSASGRTHRELASLPGPRAWPFVGNLLQLDQSAVHRTFEAWSRRYGPMYRVQWGMRPALVLANATHAAELLRARPNTFRRFAMRKVFGELGANGVFSEEGDAWRTQRALTVQALSGRNLRAFYPTLRLIAERLHGRWSEASQANRVCDVLDDLTRFTVDVTTLLTFDTDVDTLRDRGHVLQRDLEHIFPAAARRLLSPVPYWRWFKLPADRTLDRALAALRKFQERLVAEHRARLAERTIEAPIAENFLDAMLLARDEAGRPYSDEVIYGNMLTMLLAGEDTTAQSIAWTIHCLCERPDLVERARIEVDAALGSACTPPSFEAAGRLPYLDAIVNETMRHLPVAPLLTHEALEDVVVDGVRLPRGALLVLLTRPPAFDAANFYEPEKFLPERWLVQRPRDSAHAPAANMPFGFGPRICPGRTLALVEMRVVLATLLKSFDVERVGLPADSREFFRFTVGPKQLRVRYRPR